MPAKIAVIYSSTYGHVRTLAETIGKAASAAGAEVSYFRFPEILSDEVLAKMHAAPPADYPIITPDALKEFDGFLLGIPTRYGRAVASVSAFFDQTGGLWATGALIGKFAGIFTSTASQHGGQETTVFSTLPILVHHGIIFVPIGYANPNLSDYSEIIGGSPYGAAAITTGDGSRGLSEKELDIAAYQGTNFAKVVGTFVAGKAVEAAAAPAVAAKALPATTTAEVNAKPYEVTDKPAAPAPAPAPAAPATHKAPAASVKKSSGGFFCCGGKASNYDS